MKKIFAILVLVAAAGLFSAPKASAQSGCCYDYMNENRNRDQIIDSFTKQINAMQLAIIEALRLGTGQLTGNLREQTTAGHNLADAQDDRAVVGRVENARMDAISQAASGASTCNVVTSASAGSLGRSMEVTRQTMTTMMSDWATGSGDSPTAGGADVGIETRLHQHCQLYASDADQISGLCPQGVGGNDQMRDADQNVAQSLFYSDQAGFVGSMPPERFTAAQHFLINALDPVPDGRMRANEAVGANGRQIAARNMANASRLSVSKDTANFVLANRAAQVGTQVPTSGSSGATMDIVSWANSTKADVVGYSDRNYSNGVSWYDYMDLRSRSWLYSPSWMIKMDSNSNIQADKDIAVMTAFMVYQNWESYRLQERIAMTLATLLAIQVDDNRGRAMRR